MNITVFGGSQVQAGSDAYAQAQRLGELLAQRGYTVLTGGYMGTMEAVSKGAADAGGHVIGVTCEEIGRWHGRSANAWVSEEWKRGTLLERLELLIRSADAALALPGGPGTLTELALMWNLMIVGSLAPRPLILVGPGWGKLMSTFYENLGQFSPASQRDLVALASNPDAAVEMLDKMIATIGSPGTSSGNHNSLNSPQPR